MKVELICQQCGKTYERDSWDVERGRSKFCSYECYYASRRGKPFLKRRRRITKVCQRCGKEFEAGGRAGKSDQLYCSRQCARLRKNGRTMHAMGYVQITENGKRKLEHRLIVEQVLGRFLLKTEIVHHNNWDKLDNRVENLTVMSQACHRSLVDYLARLWVEEHLDIVDKVTEEFRDGFSQH